MNDDELLARLDDTDWVGTRAAMEAITQAAARLRELIAERNSYHLEYRMRCDAESKAALVRAEAAERERDEALATLRRDTLAFSSSFAQSRL